MKKDSLKQEEYKHSAKDQLIFENHFENMNRIRKNRLFPRQVSDIGAFVFVVLMMPATYIYETSVVIPAIYEEGINIKSSINYFILISTFIDI